MHLAPEERAAHLRSIAYAVWPEGTDFQRDTVLSWYSEAAGDAAESGAFYSGFCLASTEDDRITTASLLARVDPLAEQDAVVSAAGIHELLSGNPHRDVVRVDVPCGPAVLCLTGLEWKPVDPNADASSDQRENMGISMIRADLYVPLPLMSQLLVLSLTTPSLPEVPDYVAILSHIAQTLTVSAEDSHQSPEHPSGALSSIADQVRADFG
ncbi:hypothetical protein [Streptomyces sp. NPDC051569]|uniref:hypothetical protein n=1 Tax=Streptomyces sp. NPDC051569 TaxID=3365661 RepID=UPI0037A43EAC